MILWDRKNGKKPVKWLVTNRVYWEIRRILNVYRHRWTGTETFHRDGKQHLGMGDGQLRTAKGQTRHLYLVMLAHRLLMAQMGPDRANGWPHSVLTTIGQACRAVSRETLSKTIHWAVEQATSTGVESATNRHLPRAGLSRSLQKSSSHLLVCLCTVYCGKDPIDRIESYKKGA